MTKIFINRFFRYLKQNLGVLAGFFILVIAVTITIVAVICSSVTLLDGEKNNYENEKTEDGQFTVFIPLSEGTLSELCSTYGVEIQPTFSVDTINDQGVTVRLYKNRANIDKLVLKNGTVPKSPTEIVIEQLYAEKNGYDIGSKILVGDESFTISGTGCVSDYNRLIKNLTDSSTEFVYFTWGIVSDSTFEEYINSGEYSVAYTYAYILGENTDEEAFKKALTQLEFDYKEYANTNKYFSNYLDDQISQYFAAGDLVNAVNELTVASKQISEGLNTLSSYSSQFKAGLNEVETAINQLDNGSKELVSNNQAINDGMSELYTSYINVYNKFKEIKDDILSITSVLQESSGSGDTSAQSTLDSISPYISWLDDIEIILNQYKDDIKNLKDGIYDYTTGTKKLSDGLSQLKSGFATLKSNLLLYFDGVEEVKGGATKLSDGLNELNKVINDTLEDTVKSNVSNTMSIVPAEQNQRMGTTNYYANLYYKYSYVLGPILLALFALVFAIITKHQIDKENAIIGSLVALGVKKRTLMVFYLVPSFAVTLLGGLVGYFLGSSKLFVDIPLSGFNFAQSMPSYEYLRPFEAFVFAVVAPVAISLIINYFMLNKTFSRNAISLIRGVEPKNYYSKLKLKNFGFIKKFRIRQLLNDTVVSIAIIVCIAISITFVLMGIDTAVVIKNAQNTTKDKTPYNYIYAMQYPMSDLETEGEKAYLESLLVNYRGSDLSTSLIGIAEDSTYYSAVKPEKNSYSAVAGSGIASKLGLEVGDYIVLFDNGEDKNFAFKITDIVDSPANLEVYMDIDSMRTLFGQTGSYYNVIVSDSELDIDSNLVYSVTTKDSIISSYDSQFIAMLSFINMAVIAAVILYAAVLYLIVSMLVTRNALGISLARVLGYRGREIRSLYIQGVSYVVIGSLIVAIPLAKLLADKLCSIVYKVLAIGNDYSVDFYWYIIILAGALLIFAIILRLVIYKIRTINTTDILRSRL